MQKQKIKMWLIWVSGSTIMSTAALALVIAKLDPYESDQLALVLFYLSAFFAMSGFFSLILFCIKNLRMHENKDTKFTSVSLRQGILLSLATLLCAALLMFGMLRIWNGLMIVACITALEFFLSGKDELT